MTLHEAARLNFQFQIAIELRGADRLAQILPLEGAGLRADARQRQMRSEGALLRGKTQALESLFQSPDQFLQNGEFAPQPPPDHLHPLQTGKGAQTRDAQTKRVGALSRILERLLDREDFVCGDI